MRLTALVAGPDHVCCRYRLAAFRPALERAGHALELVPWPRRRDWLWRLPALRQADAVIVQRRLPHTVLLRLLRGAARRLVFDFDDAVFMNDSYDRRGPESPVKWLRFAALVRTADAVVAGNAFLAEEAARWAGRGRVRVIPTCAEPAHYPLAAHTAAGDGVELVWIGSASTLQGLERSRPLWEEVGRRCPGVRLKLVCDRFLTFENLPVAPLPWSEAGEAVALASADIGISWLPDDRWSLGKCGLKVLQYMAAGLPVIANPVGVQRDLVRAGEGGFLAETADQWAEAVTRLARDPELRRRMGAANRRRVEAEFSVAAGAAAWLGLLDELARDRRAA